MPNLGKEYKLAIRIAGVIDKSLAVSLAGAKSALRANIMAIDADFAKLDKGFNKIVGIGKKAFSAIATGATVAATAIGAATAASIQVGAEFEAQMSTVKAISGATAEEMEQLTAKAREMGATTKFSATEVGQAMEYMGMAGWKAKDMMDGIEGIIALAAASGEELSIVSDMVTDDLTAFGLSAKDAGHFSDVMAATAMNANTNVAMMADAFKYAAPMARSLGYNMEEVALATGLMANSGIKSTIAGTSLRNLFTRMAKPTKESAEAMEALGISLENDAGEMYSFMEIMEQLRKAYGKGMGDKEMAALTTLGGLTDEQIEEEMNALGELSEIEQAYYAAELAGQRGISGLLAITNATDEEFAALAKEIENCEGAARRMSAIKMDNLQGDTILFTDALRDVGITYYNELQPMLREFVQWATDAVTSLGKGFPDVLQKIQEGFPSLQRKFKKFAGPVFNGILDFGKWIVKNGRVITSVLVGIGSAMAAYKIASEAMHLVAALTSLATLNPATWGILAVVGALGALAGAFAFLKMREDELRDASLEEHFGNIALSMKEINAIADSIVSSHSLEGMKNALSEFGKLDELDAAMEEAVGNLNKLNWKVSVGIELTDDEKNSYKGAIDEYIKNANAYIEQARYAVSISLKVGLGESSEANNIASKVDQFFQDNQEEMVSLGKDLSDAVNEAFSDNILDPEELDEIAGIQAKMAELKQQIAKGELSGEMARLGVDFQFMSDLTPEAFFDMVESLNEKVAEAKKTAGDAYSKNYAVLQAAGLSEDEFAEAKKLLDEKYLDDVYEIQFEASSFEVDSVMAAYEEDITAGAAKMQSIINDSIRTGMEQADAISDPAMLQTHWADTVVNTREAVMNGNLVDQGDKLALQEMYNTLQPALDSLEDLRDRYVQAGQEIPAEINEAINNILTIGAVSGDADAIYSIIGQQLMDNEEYATVINLAEKQGGAIPEKVIEAMTDDERMAQIKDNTDYILNNIEDQLEQGVYADIPITYNLVDEMLAGKKNRTGASIRYYDQMAIDHNAEGGIIQSKELSWLAEEGPEAVIPLDGSREAFALWEQVGQMFSNGEFGQTFMQTTNEGNVASYDNREFSNYTQNFDESVANYYANGADQASSMFERAMRLMEMGSAFEGADLSEPEGGMNLSPVFQPTLNFYSNGTPDREDIDDAVDYLQNRFEEYMESYLKHNRRVSFT